MLKSNLISLFGKVHIQQEDPPIPVTSSPENLWIYHLHWLPPCNVTQN